MKYFILKPKLILWSLFYLEILTRFLNHRGGQYALVLVCEEPRLHLTREHWSARSQPIIDLLGLGSCVILSKLCHLILIYRTLLVYVEEKVENQRHND